MKGKPSLGKCFRQINWSIKIIRMFKKLGWNRPDMPKSERAVLHSFRHTFCSQMVMKGYNERTVMAAMGWKSTTQLKTYAHLAPDYLQNAVNTVDCGPKEDVPQVLKEFDRDLVETPEGK